MQLADEPSALLPFAIHAATRLSFLCPFVVQLLFLSLITPDCIRTNVSRRREFLHWRRELHYQQTDQESAGVVVAFFAVFSEVETRYFDFFRWTQIAEDEFYHVGDDDCSDDGQSECDADGFELFDPERLADDVFEVRVRL